MTENASRQSWTPAGMAARIVRYADLQPCYNAFIDTRTPGSEAKENFTIIGPGVSENPEQHVHIAEPHGFNIGGARQPPNCVNSQHSHDTAEVFVVHSGHWRFDLGEHGDDAQVLLAPGDVVSLPVGCFRGFTNVGDDIGFLWAVLGGDDPGRVTWAPQVFDLAAEHGLVLLETGQLLDSTRGDVAPAGVGPMPRTSAAQVAALRRIGPTDAENLAWRATPGAGETPVIAPGAALDGPHPFTLSRIDLAAGEALAAATPATPEVLFVHRGEMTIGWDGGAVTLAAGDTMTVPIGLTRRIASAAGGVGYRVSGL
ncbi:cupin domain-containing protein [Sandarakinorhabdus sp. DWP1-3-1]|uniref:cupin domain-containing protein n=1 Tax=Sandarakinorhabdus sp. DWP1-3-1 TaxID=2804627 RepID=UPI003CED8C96